MVIKSRLEDIEVGDVVNRSPEAELGWFTVDAITTLFNGHLQLADVTEQLTVSGDHKDMVGLQLVEEIELDDRGLVAPAAPMPVVAAPVPAADHAPVENGNSAHDAAAAAEHREVDIATEMEVAAQIATGMDGPSGVGTQSTSAANLALVAELLEDLDLGEAPAVTDAATTPEGSPAAPSAGSAMPEGARPVFGSELPEKPSYKNPVVVPEGTVLPRRGRAA